MNFKWIKTSVVSLASFSIGVGVGFVIGIVVGMVFLFGMLWKP